MENGCKRGTKRGEPGGRRPRGPGSLPLFFLRRSDGRGAGRVSLAALLQAPGAGVLGVRSLGWELQALQKRSGAPAPTGGWVGGHGDGDREGGTRVPGYVRADPQPSLHGTLTSSHTRKGGVAVIQAKSKL